MLVVVFGAVVWLLWFGDLLETSHTVVEFSSTNMEAVPPWKSSEEEKP